MIEALANDYLSTRSDEVSIQWICNHSRNTQLALLYGHVDLALTYERDQEQISLSEGWANTSGCAFRDHFCIVGPIDDSANIKTCSTISDAMTRIEKSRSQFHSRVDSSATMFKERQLWVAADLAPWDDEGSASSWYRTSVLGPADALIQADEKGAYLLTDRSTLLKQTELGSVKNCTCFFESKSADDVLMNDCHALYSTTADQMARGEVKAFLGYLHSDRGQSVIGSYGVDTVGHPLFARVKDECASTSLVGGRPSGRKWISMQQT